jgi:hypothetical protein
MGRKNKYETHVKPHLKDIPKWYEIMTESQIAKKLGISVASFEIYKNKYPELVECLKKSKEALIDELKATLKMKAKGFTYKETKKTIRSVGGEKVVVIEEYEKYAQPDTGAIHLLLKNIDASWHNDDVATLELKRKQLDLTERKIEQNEW